MSKMIEPIRNKVLECALPLFLRARVFLEKEQGAGVTSDFRDSLIADFVVFEQKAFANQIDPMQVENVKYALTAFIDEVVMNSAWPQRLDWMGRPLQLQFFGEHLAGEGFFHRLSQLRQSGVTQTDSLEVYYLCLQLGFQGMYRLRGTEQLQALQVGLRSQIDAARGAIDPHLSPEGIPLAPLISKVSREIPFWVIAVVTIAIIFFIYLGYSIAMDTQTSNAVQQVNIVRNLLCNN